MTLRLTYKEIHDTGAKPLEFKLISELFDYGMDRLISAEARILDDEEGIAFVDRS